MDLICKKWMFNKNADFSGLMKLKELDFSSVILAFTKRLSQIPYKFSKSEQVSCSICFFGSILTSLLNYGYIEDIEGLFTFALCYMLVDHFLDDDQIDEQEKKRFIQDVSDFLKGERVKNKIINLGSQRYQELIARNPDVKDYFVRLFYSEMKGVEIQKRKDLPREVYLDIALEKGGCTALVIGKILKLQDEKGSFQLGATLQLVDDILDLKDDENLGIYTLARYDKDHNNLDKYVEMTVKKIDELPSVYNFFKIILLYSLVLGVHDNAINNDILKYDIFGKESKDSLLKWFYDELYKTIDKLEINI